MDRNIITIMSGQIVDFFDRDFRELYAMSRELNLFKEFSISKQNTTASTRATVTTRPALPATSRFNVSLGDKGTLKVPAHKYHNPKYLLALGNLPEDISTPQALLSKMEESIEKFAAEGNPVEEDEILESQAPPLSPKGGKGNGLSRISLKKRFTGLKQKRASKKEGKAGEGDPGPSTTTNLTPATSTIGDITESPENPTAETKSKKKASKKASKKSKSPKSEDQGMYNHCRCPILSFSLDFGEIMTRRKYSCLPFN